MKFRIIAIILSSFLFGCDKDNDGHIYTLYSSYKNNRSHLATFDATPISWDEKKTDEQFRKWFEEANFNSCNKVAKLLKDDWISTVKTNEIEYWCEKGRFRK